MLRIIISDSAQAAKKYFDGQLQHGDYYVGEKEEKGIWQGRAAKMLGLSGEIAKEDFHALCDNIRPDTGRNLTAKTIEERRVGFDLNFHCPKSVSVLWAQTGDARIVEAFRHSVRSAMHMIEQDAQCRVRNGGADYSRDSGNLIYGEFIHTTARPVDGIPDPHIHAHCYVMNATYDHQGGKWKALDPGKFWEDAPFYEAVFHSKLAIGMKALGYGIEKNNKYWEIEGIPKNLIKEFSRRTDQVEKYAAQNNITDAKGKDKIGSLTREKKNENLSLDELFALWQKKMNGTDFTPVFNPASGSLITPRQGMDFAISHEFETKSVSPLRSLQATALLHGVGHYTFKEIEHIVLS